jgi:hypothetical protein
MLPLVLQALDLGLLALLALALQLSLKAQDGRVHRRRRRCRGGSLVGEKLELKLAEYESEAEFVKLPNQGAILKWRHAGRARSPTLKG